MADRNHIELLLVPVAGAALVVLFSATRAPAQGNDAAGQLYWVDLESHTIQRSGLEGSDLEVLVRGVSGVSLAVDPVGGRLYWTDYATDSTGVIRRSM